MSYIWNYGLYVLYLYQTNLNTMDNYERLRGKLELWRDDLTKKVNNGGELLHELKSEDKDGVNKVTQSAINRITLITNSNRIVLHKLTQILDRDGK
jgi:hypothetical protein